LRAQRAGRPKNAESSQRLANWGQLDVYAIYVFYSVIALGKGNSNRAGFLVALTNSSKESSRKIKLISRKEMNNDAIEEKG
jgi:hypothetical protein